MKVISGLEMQSPHASQWPEIQHPFMLGHLGDNGCAPKPHVC